MLADVVISTRDNRRDKAFSLLYVVRSLLHQEGERLNILIADNGSKDDTKDALGREFGQKVQIVDTSGLAGNISASRNAAAACGSAELILFMDDDTIVSRMGDLETCVEIGRKVDFACGARRLWAPRLWPKIIRPDDPIRKVISTLEHTALEPTSINRISGKNILDNRSYIGNFGTVQRHTFNAVGGYDESYTGWGYQDTDLMWRLCTAGYEYELFSRSDITIFHLSHQVDKSERYEKNRERFMEKQKNDGRIFQINHFFEIYKNDGYSLFEDFPNANAS